MVVVERVACGPGLKEAGGKGVVCPGGSCTMSLHHGISDGF